MVARVNTAFIALLFIADLNILGAPGLRFSATQTTRTKPMYHIFT